jgi:hypothetical protein
MPVPLSSRTDWRSGPWARRLTSIARVCNPVRRSASQATRPRGVTTMPRIASLNTLNSPAISPRPNILQPAYCWLMRASHLASEGFSHWHSFEGSYDDHVKSLNTRVFVFHPQANFPRRSCIPRPYGTES